MKKIYLFIILSFFFISFSFAQKEASYWYFGNKAELNFSSGVPVAETNGSLITLEGSTSISNAVGNLLFYTDGSTVWNKNHKVMPTGKFLFGHSSSTQSAIIVPKPENQDIYYIFTVDWSGGKNGLNYYTIDMTLDGGLGDVIGINKIPTPTNLLLTPVGEKITAIKVFNEKAFWVISFKEGRFYVYKVNKDGVNSREVSGNSGFSGFEDPRGYLKVSPDGTKLVSANMREGVFLYDFDNATGKISNERQLDVLGEFPYGVEFSPKSKKLYLSTGNFGFGPALEKLFQFTVDMTLPTSQNINASRVELHAYTNARAALQLGIDGKIYRAIHNTNFLGVINNPEEDGLNANYQHNSISLGINLSQQGLPPFIQSFFTASVQIKNQCLGDITSFKVKSNEPIISILWDFGDGTLSSPSTSTLINPTHIYTSSGDYTISVQVTTADEVKIITQTITIFDLPNIISTVTLQQCDDDTDGITNFNLHKAETLVTNDNRTSTFTYYLTREEANLNTNAIPIENLTTFSNATTNQIFVRVENQFNCFEIAKINLQVSTTSIPKNFMLNINECDINTNGIATFNFESAIQDISALFPTNQNLTITFYENITDALTENNIIDATNYRNEKSPFSQQLAVRVDSQKSNACLGLGYHLTLNVVPLPKFDVVNSQYLCLNSVPSPLTLSVENPQRNYKYEWKDQHGNILNTNSTSPFLKVTAVGDYFVTAITEDNCSSTKKITVTPSNIAIIEDIKIVDFSQNNTVTINVTGEGKYEFSLNDINGLYQDENIFTNVAGGIHTIFIRDKNGCGVISKEISVISFPKFFTPNGDGFNDTWQILGIDFQPTSLIYIFNRFGKIMARIDGTNKGWDGRYNGRLLPESDYWFKVKLEDGRIFKGHFSLIKK